MVCTRPDIASTDVGMLDGFDHGLQTYVQVFVDFDYVMGRSITRYGFMILGCAGSLKANLQHMEDLSTTEAGYITFTEAWKKKMWLKGLLTESRYELRLENKDFREEDKERIIVHGLPKKLRDPSNFTFPVRVNGNTQAKATGEVRNMRLGRPFFRTCGALIDMGRGTMTIDDRVIKHTYYPKPRVKVPLNNLDMDEDED
uniref:Zinc finger, CCHC-type n=1 Tax=Tanacetum cinerariifolium TaxID=118510 RepID=A0A699II80_TANCI|nr:zinc finger, CCHC-type [Tanacetum cinerariifolium]